MTITFNMVPILTTFGSILLLEVLVMLATKSLNVIKRG